MAVGRPPKPTALKVLQGNPGKRPLNDAEPVPDGSLPPNPPDWLAPLAKRHYRKLASILFWLTDADTDKLALYCQAYARYREYTLLMARLDFTDEMFRTWEIKDIVDFLKNLPIRLRDTENVMRGIGSELGMDPVSRTRIHATKPQTGDSFDAWERGEANG